MPHALIVHAHPEPNSFCTAQMRKAAQTLQEQGYTVEISDLYAMNWNPSLGRSDFRHVLEGHFKPGPEQTRAAREGTFAPDVTAELEKLQRADLLVLSFPMWWFSLPAILKGWVDRVFTMGIAYGGGVGTFDKGGFRGRQAMLLFTTGSLEEHFGPEARDGEMDVILFHILHGMFWFCGFTALESVVSFAPTKGTPETRAQQLERVGEAFSDLPSRAVKFG
ncbi:NAD(P)H-dependent oxidoreductase [Deinococcus alpinitundrae]|uniref:NAD(P)H-dependent oxidoreductase n=1 Tax=Deinococcus alpinitundrae TaxID=468913 RepID=UPI00137A2472|nr:NAD(P)H-dependent oxidoreductase [Deinococcus alpinitundrae]